MFTNEDLHTEIRSNQNTIDTAYRLGKTKPNYNSPLMEVLCKLSDKEFTLINRKKLPRNVLVDEDYPVGILQRRHTLWPILKIAIKIDKYKGKATLKYDKLILDGIEHGVEDLNNLPEDMLTLLSCQKSDENTMVFFGQHSPFSNFYQASFEHDGHHFKTSEHAIQ